MAVILKQIQGMSLTRLTGSLRYCNFSQAEEGRHSYGVEIVLIDRELAIPVRIEVY